MKHVQQTLQVATLVAVIASQGCVSNTPPPAKAQAPKLIDLIDGPRADVISEGTPLVDLLAVLSQQYGVEVGMEWRNMEEDGIDRNMPIRVEAKNATLADVLAAMRAADDPEWRCPVIVRGDKLLITSERVADADRVREVYDVRPLIEAMYGAPQLWREEGIGSPDEAIFIIAGDVPDPRWRSYG